jgi:hypothetical protein
VLTEPGIPDRPEICRERELRELPRRVGAWIARQTWRAADGQVIAEIDPD